MITRPDVCCTELFLSIIKKRHVLQDDVDRENEKWVIVTEYLPPSTYSHCLASFAMGEIEALENNIIPITPLKLPICPFCYKIWNKTAIKEKKLLRSKRRAASS